MLCFKLWSPRKLLINHPVGGLQPLYLLPVSSSFWAGLWKRQALKGHEAIVEEAVVEEAVVEEAVAEQAVVEEAVVE